MLKARKVMVTTAIMDSAHPGGESDGIIILVYVDQWYGSRRLRSDVEELRFELDGTYTMYISDILNGKEDDFNCNLPLLQAPRSLAGLRHHQKSYPNVRCWCGLWN